MYDYWYYQNYINSNEWIEKSTRIKRRQNNTCYLCGNQNDLQTHHLTYQRLGKEQDADLIGLCESCHSRIHFLVKNYRNGYAFYEEALRWSWQDAIMLKAIPYEEPCILCGDTSNLKTAYNVSRVLDDLINICEKCRWRVFALSAYHRAQYCPHDVSMAYGLRDAKIEAKRRGKHN